MKKQLFFFLIFVTQFSFCQYKPDIDIDKLIIGEWAGKDITGNSNIMIFEEDSYVSLSIRNRNYGRKFEGNSGKYVYQYSIDSKKNPMQLDIIIFRKETNKEEKRIRSIIKFIDNNTIETRTDENPLKYPKEFLGKENENTAILKRVQN